jgi:ABC-2 type transport system permease protein
MTVIPLQISATLTPSAAMPAGRVLRAYLAEAKYESLRMLRTPGFAVPLLALPVLLYLLFGVVLFGDALRADPKSAVFLFTGMAVFGAMGPGMFGFGAVLAIEREIGVLKLKRALPMPPAAYLVAKLAMAMLFNAIIMATMIGAALAVGHLKPGAALGVAVINVLAALPFCALGLLIGTLAKGQAGAALTNLVYLPMMWLSGLFIPLSKFMQTLAQVWPAYHVNQLAQSAAGAPSHGAAIVHVAVLAGETLIFAALAVRRLARVG